MSEKETEDELASLRLDTRAKQLGIHFPQRT